MLVATWYSPPVPVMTMQALWAPDDSGGSLSALRNKKTLTADQLQSP